MKPVKNTWIESGSSDICPVTGLHILRRPEWSNVRFSKDYRATISILGDNILLVQPSGYATQSDVENVFGLIHKIETETLSGGRPYVQISDYSNVQGASLEARKYFIDSVKKRERLLGLIFYGVSPFFKLSIKLGQRFNIVKFNVKIADDYSDAVKLSQKLLSTSETKTEYSFADVTVQPIKASNRNRSCHKIITHPEWYFQTENFSLKFEIINGFVLHGISTGRLEKEHINPCLRMKENVIKSIGLFPGSYYYILGLKESEGTDQRARKLYVKAILEFYKKYPFEMFIFYGANRLLRAGINLARLLVPFKVRVVEDLDRALAAIAEEKYSGTSPSLWLAAEDSTRKILKSDQIQHYVDDLLQYLEGINWESDGFGENGERDPSHPFGPVFDALASVSGL